MPRHSQYEKASFDVRNLSHIGILTVFDLIFYFLLKGYVKVKRWRGMRVQAGENRSLDEQLLATTELHILISLQSGRKN